MSSKEKAARIVQSVTAWRIRVKIRAVEYKGGKCEVCGYDKCLRALAFHHRDPSKKDFALSRITISWARMKKELDKCSLVCANCHSEIHDGLIEGFLVSVL